MPPPKLTQTVLTPSREVTDQMIAVLLDAEETFSVEPSPTRPGSVWHVGVMDSAIPLIAALFGPTRDIGTVGDYRVD